MTTLSSSVGGNSPRLTDEQLRELKDIDYDGQLERTLTEAGYSHGFESLSKRTANFLLDKKNARGFERRRRLNAYGRGDRSTSQPLQRSGQNSARNLGLSRLVADVYNNSLEYALGEEVYQDFLDDAYSILKKSKGSQSPSFIRSAKIELLAGTLAQPEYGSNPNTNNSISGANLLNGVEKSYDKGKNFWKKAKGNGA